MLSSSSLSSSPIIVSAFVVVTIVFFIITTLSGWLWSYFASTTEWKQKSSHTSHSYSSPMSHSSLPTSRNYSSTTSYDGSLKSQCSSPTARPECRRRLAKSDVRHTQAYSEHSANRRNLRFPVCPAGERQVHDGPHQVTVSVVYSRRTPLGQTRFGFEMRNARLLLVLVLALLMPLLLLLLVLLLVLLLLLLFDREGETCCLPANWTGPWFVCFCSAAGPWLKYRGHLDNISNNMFIGWVVTLGHLAVHCQSYWHAPQKSRLSTNYTQRKNAMKMGSTFTQVQVIHGWKRYLVSGVVEMLMRSIARIYAGLKLHALPLFSLPVLNQETGTSEPRVLSTPRAAVHLARSSLLIENW